MVRNRIKILILTTGHLCRNPRVLKEATSLGKAGHDVVVIGVRNHKPSEPLDAELLRNAPFRMESLNMLPGSGLASFGSRLKVKFFRARAARGLGESVHALGPARELLISALAHPADLTICHNEIALWVGVQLLNLGRNVAADFEDWYSEDLLPEDRRCRPLHLLRTLEHTLLSRCRYVTTTSHALADALHARYGGQRPEVVSNSFPLQPDPFRRGGKPRSPPRFFWFSQTLGPGRGLEGFLRAWVQSKNASEVVLMGEDRGGYSELLRRWVPIGTRDRLHFRPTVPPGELPGVVADHDIGLALEESSIVNRDLTITNKILQYLNAGLAVVATPTTGQREVLYHQPEAGIFFDPVSPDAPHALRELATDTGRLNDRQRSARQLAEKHYNWELEAGRLERLVARAL